MSLPQWVQAVVFDMDGVLWLSSPIHAWAFRETLARADIQDFDYTLYAGMRTKECLAQVFREHRRGISDAGIEELATEKSRLALEALRSNPPVTAGCKNVICELHSRVKVGLASSGSQATVDLFLEASGCREAFSAVLCGSTVERAKPAPDIYQKVFRLLDVAPDKAIVVEDSVAGVEAGKAAGSCVWAIPSTCTQELLLAAGADQIILSLERLL